MKKQKLLIICNGKKMADELRYELKESGFIVKIGSNETTAAELFTEHRFDLVIIDIEPAVKNGYELCRQFKSFNSSIPVILLIPYTKPTERLEGYHAGADGYIIKPFEFKELLFKINIFFKISFSNSGEKKTNLKAADLEMNTETKTVKRNNKLIQLTSKEFQLLEFLLRNKNRIISRSELALHVWETDFDTNTNIVEVYINYLRNKIDKNFPHKLISTQVGMGYILKD